MTLPILLQLFTWRHWRRAPWTTGLLVLMLALGVAVYVAIRLANKAAVAGFSNFTELVTVQSDFVVKAPAGRLSEGVLPELRELLEPYAATLVPVIETTAAPVVAGEGGRDEASLKPKARLTVLGLDLVALQNLRSGGTVEELGVALKRLEVAGAVFVSEAMMAGEGRQAGGVLEVVLEDRVAILQVAGVLPDQPGQVRMPETLLVMDLPVLQGLLDRGPSVDRVEVMMDKGRLGTAQRDAVGRVLGEKAAGRWVVTTVEERREAAGVMTQAFRWNLGILSLLALLVGLYLVFQALDGAVVRRREEIGIMRSLGVSPAGIQGLWLLEALMLGALGGGLGILLGWLGAAGAVGMVAETVNTLYHRTQAAPVTPDGVDVGIGLLFGILAGLVAGWWPARLAALTPPAQMLSRHGSGGAAGGTRGKAAGWGGLLLVLAVLLAGLPALRLEGGARFALAGYLSALLMLLGGGLVLGGVLGGMARLLERTGLGRLGTTLQLALSQLRKPGSRHRLAVAALACAVAMTAGMAILVGSFDRTMRGWIELTFQADLYLASAGGGGMASQNSIRRETAERIAARPDVAEVNAMRFLTVRLEEGETQLTGTKLAWMREKTVMAWVEPPLGEEVFETAANAGLCLVSESFAERFGKQRGDQVSFATADGARVLRIAGVFSDYGNERGSVVVDGRHFERWFPQEPVSRLVLMLQAGADAEAVRAELLREFSGLAVFTNGHLRREVMRIFRQTFAITHALELIGMTVAVVGLGITLASVLLERRAELTTMRALGMRPGEMARAAAWEGVALAACGVLGGLGVSLGLGWLLVYVINKQTFGWTLQWATPWGQAAVLGMAVLLSAAVVSYGVGRWGSGLPADREE